MQLRTEFMVQLRECLRCEGTFRSRGWHHRVCWLCKEELKVIDHTYLRGSIPQSGHRKGIVVRKEPRHESDP